MKVAQMKLGRVLNASEMHILYLYARGHRVYPSALKSIQHITQCRWEMETPDDSNQAPVDLK